MSRGPASVFRTRVLDVTFAMNLGWAKIRRQLWPVARVVSTGRSSQTFVFRDAE